MSDRGLMKIESRRLKKRISFLCGTWCVSEAMCLSEAKKKKKSFTNLGNTIKPKKSYEVMIFFLITQRLKKFLSYPRKTW